MSRYQLFRRRLAPIAFVLGMGLVVRETCTKEQRTHATIQIDLGADLAAAQSVEADLLVGDESIGHFRRTRMMGLAPAKCSFEVAMTADDGELRIDVDLGDHHHLVKRAIHATENATIVARVTP